MEFSAAAAKARSSSNLASINYGNGNGDCLELVWRNGRVVARGVSSSTAQKAPSRTGRSTSTNPFEKPRNSPMQGSGKVSFSNFTGHSAVIDSSGGSGGLLVGGPKGIRSQKLPCKKSEATGDHCSAALGAKRKLADAAGLCNGLPLVESSVACSFGASNNMCACSRRQEDIDDDSTRLSDNDEETEDVAKEKHAREGTRVKRSRNTEIHNLSERRRRDKINKKLRVLKELIPNCNKVDKASMLDDAIEYLKTLQLRLQVMSMGTGLCMPLMMLPTAPHQMVNTSHLPQLMGDGMGFRPGTTVPCNLPQFPFRPLPGITDNRVGMFGFPNQLTHMPMLHAPFIPMVGKPSTQPLQPTCNATNLAENLASAQLNTPIISAPNHSVPQAQSAINQAQNQGFLHL